MESVALVRDSIEVRLTPNSELPFWEAYIGWDTFDQDGENISRSGNPAYLVTDPNSERQFVVKSRDFDRNEYYSDPRKIAIFQEAIRYYGVQHIPEVTVLPSLEMFEAEMIGRRQRDQSNTHPPEMTTQDYKEWAKETFLKNNYKGLRVAEFVPDLVDNIGREEWFPTDIFDDHITYPYHAPAYRDGRKTYVWDTYDIKKLTLNPDKFKTWYESVNEAEQEKAKKSLKSIHAMINDGFFFDLLGIGNLAFHEGQFVLTDTEPLLISSIPYNTNCLGYSQRTLNGLFTAVGLPKVKYKDIVQRLYGDEFKLESLGGRGHVAYDWQGNISYPSELWSTNVTSDLELELYRKQLAKIKENPLVEHVEEMDFPKELMDKYNELLEMPDEFFEDRKFKWTRDLKK